MPFSLCFELQLELDAFPRLREGFGALLSNLDAVIAEDLPNASPTARAEYAALLRDVALRTDDSIDRAYAAAALWVKSRIDGEAAAAAVREPLAS